MLKRLAIITTHPIQYYAPWFALLAAREKIEIKVFYTWEQSQNRGKYDPDFKKQVEWDVPLLEGYNYIFVKNVAANHGSHHFKGIDNPTLIAEVEHWKADAILVFGWSFKSHLKCLRYFCGKIPVLFRGDSTLLDETPGLRKILRRFFLRWIYSKVNVSLYVGTNNKQYYLRHGMREKQLKFAPHAIDNNRFTDAHNIYTTKAKQWRAQLNIPQEAIVFLFAGKLEPKKNPELLLEAFQNLKQQYVHLIIVGNGVEEQFLKNKYSGSLNVHFIDFQNQSVMPVVYNLCDVFVLPSKGPEETWGLSVNEAMACKKAVIASTRCGGAIDLIQNGINGYMFESGNRQDLEEKMNKLAASKTLVQQMGESSFSIIKNFSFDKICDQVEQTVASIK